MSEEYIRIAECKDRGVYVLNSRNLRLGVYDEAAKCFNGVRQKFGDRFIAMEYHWDTGVPYGTAKPTEYLGPLPASIPNALGKDLIQYLDEMAARRRKVEAIQEFCSGHDEEILLADGFEDAFLGVAQKFNTQSACYDFEKCVQVLMTRDGMSDEEAVESLHFNTLGAWAGEHTPVFLFLKKDAG